MPQSPRDQRQHDQRWMGLVFIGLSVVVITIDNTVLSTALPSISRQLGASTNELQWIVDGYVLVFASLLLTAGSIGDRIGRKKALQIGLVWFMLASLAAAASTSTGMLIATRALLAVGSALILPATLSIITATFPPDERAQAIATWAGIFGLGIGIGPVLGGFLLEHFNWSAVFLINVPTGLVALAGGAYFLGESRDEHAPAPDVPGVLLSVIGLVALVYGIIAAGVRGWLDPQVLVSLAAGMVVLAVFASWEARTPNAMLPMRFFKNMSFTSASITLALLTFAQFSILFMLVPFLQTVQGYSTLQSGLRLVPQAVTITVMASLSARLSRRIGIKYTVALGILISAIGDVLIAITFRVDTPYAIVLLTTVITGLGFGLAFSPATNSIMGSVPIDKAGVGSAMNDTTRQLGGALGIALLGSVLNLGYIGHLSALHSGLSADLLAKSENSVQAAHAIAATLSDPAIARTLTSAADQAYVSGMSQSMLVGVVVLIGAELLTLRYLPAQIRVRETVVIADD